jgi:hypothetical protein
MGAADQESGGDEILTPAGGTGEPRAGDHPGAFCADVVAALGRLAKVINQRLQFGPFRSQQGFAVELGGRNRAVDARRLSAGR